jgi:hypothetical protein
MNENEKNKANDAPQPSGNQETVAPGQAEVESGDVQETPPPEFVVMELTHMKRHSGIVGVGKEPALIDIGAHKYEAHPVRLSFTPQTLQKFINFLRFLEMN